MIDLAVVDNDRMLLDGVGSWLGRVADLRLVATATTVDELLCGPSAASVVLLDLLLGDGSSPGDNVRRLVAAGHRVLVVSVSDRTDDIATVFAAGASGYLTKDNDLAALVTAVRDVDAGGLSCSPELALACLNDPRPDRPSLTRRERGVLVGYGCGMHLTAVARRLRLAPDVVASCLDGIAAKYHRAGASSATASPGPSRPSPLSPLTLLTPRERQIATLVTEGLTNKQIARRLGVTAKTIEKHLTNTMTKLHVPSRAAVAGLVGRATVAAPPARTAPSARTGPAGPASPDRAPTRPTA